MIKVKNGWGMYSDEGNVIHIIPENDVAEHSQGLIFPIEPTDIFKQNLKDGLLIIDKIIEFTCDCECSPKIEYVTAESAWRIIHNSFDGREHFEPDNKVRQN